jgi:histidinol-phosphatase (PHP family)
MTAPSQPPAWRVSLHGGHCGAYCDHARGELRGVLDAAVANGFAAYGISEHAPRLGEQWLYDTECEMGWDVAKISADFERYAADSARLQREYADRLEILRGFEAEVVPPDRYVEVMLGYRERYAFDYMVGSVHFVDALLIDGPVDLFNCAVDGRGGLEPFAVAYYEAMAGMIENLKPEVVGHFDLIRKNAPPDADLETPAIRDAAKLALKAAQVNNCILDLNTAGWRKDLGTPYPAPWLVRLAHDMRVPFCFGDDSHGPDDVGAGIDEGREYLLDCGVQTVTTLRKAENGALEHRTVPLTV